MKIYDQKHISGWLSVNFCYCFASAVTFCCDGIVEVTGAEY